MVSSHRRGARYDPRTLLALSGAGGDDRGADHGMAEERGRPRKGVCGRGDVYIGGTGATVTNLSRGGSSLRECRGARTREP